MNIDTPQYAVLDTDSMVKLIAHSGANRRVVELPEFARYAVTFDNAPRDFTLNYSMLRDGKQIPAQIHVERGEVVLVNVAAQQSLLAHDQKVKMFFHQVHIDYSEEVTQ